MLSDYPPPDRDIRDNFSPDSCWRAKANDLHSDRAFPDNSAQQIHSCPMMRLMITPDHSPLLLDAFDRQDEVFEFAFSILQEAIDQKALPGATAAVTHHGRLVVLKGLGRFTYEPNSPPIPPATLFDLASLTKVVATTAMAMVLYKRGLLDLDTPVAAIVPEFTLASEEDPRRGNVTLRMLLAHSSGLPAYEKLFLKCRTRDELLQAAFAMPLTADPGTRAEYSDIGFIILGTALERLADEPLDRFCQREIFAPLAMANTAFNPPPKLRAEIPPTADDQTFRHRVVQGEVQDENASVLGGVAPHAGLFAPAVDIARLAQCMLDGGRQIFRPETVALFTRGESAPVGTTRTLGWDTPSTPSQSGKYFSQSSFGHLGYTGTSLWIDQQRQLSITLLTNRTWPDCSNWAIKQVRPRFHDAVVEALEKV
jgi:CubicO group peptidase (beta-lactamase class C family)